MSGGVTHPQPVAAPPKAELTALVGPSPCCFSLCSINAHSVQGAEWDLTTSCPGFPPQQGSKEHDGRSAQVSSAGDPWPRREG